MNILLTGATGFLGSHIAELLAEQSYFTRCIVRSTSDTRFLQNLKNIEIIQGSLQNENILKDALNAIDIVIHNAGITRAIKADDFYTTHVGSTHLLLESIKKYAPQVKRFIFISSLAAAGPSQANQPHRDDVKPSPISHYGRSKWMAELKALEYKDLIPITIIRPPPIYGPRDKNMLIFFKALQYGVVLLPLRGLTELSLIHAYDAASVIVKSIEIPAPSGSTYFIEDGKIYLFKEVMNQLCQIIQKKHVIKIPLPHFFLKLLTGTVEKYSQWTGTRAIMTQDKLKEMQHLYWTCNSSKIKEELQWQPLYDWTSGSYQTYEWYKKMGWI